MFSSIEPYAPRRHYLPGNLFPTLRTTTRTRITLYFYQPMKRQLAHVLRLPVNQLCAVFLRLRSRSQLIFTCNSVKLLDSSVYFPTHPHVPLISLPLPLFDRELFCRPLVHIHSIGDVIPSTSIVKNGVILVIPFKLLFFLINGFRDKCCWRQPFSSTLKRCLGCLAWVRNGGHIHFPSLPSLLELGIGTRHPASVPRDTHLMVLYATR